ncbi:hypothetical protein Trydic_g2174 [Trypoxylus dichotomus]
MTTCTIACVKALVIPKVYWATNVRIVLWRETGFNRSSLNSFKTKFYTVFEIKKCSTQNANKRFIVLQTGGDGENVITEGLRSALARLRQRSSTPASQTSPLHQPASPSPNGFESHAFVASVRAHSGRYIDCIKEIHYETRRCQADTDEIPCIKY